MRKNILAFLVLLPSICFSFSNDVLVFEENKGQFKGQTKNSTSDIFFKCSQGHMSIWVTSSGLTFEFKDYETDSKEKSLISKKVSRLDVNLVSAKLSQTNIKKSNPSRQVKNYYLPHCPDGITGVLGYSDLLIEEIYPGIDWHLVLENGSFKQEFIVAPGADPSNIHMAYEGIGEIEIGDTYIEVSNDIGVLRESGLVSLQEGREIQTTYSVQRRLKLSGLGLGLSRSTNQYENGCSGIDIKFSIADYNKNEPLIIDPEIEWATLVGAGDWIYPWEAEINDQNDLLIVADVDSDCNFPFVTGFTGAYFQGSTGGWFGEDALITKFDSSKELVWSTYYGGYDRDRPQTLGVDSQGDIWVSGYTLSGDDTDAFPIFNGGGYYQPQSGLSGWGAREPFLLRFDQNGVREHATYFGSDANDEAFDLVIDKFDNVWITGTTDGDDDFPFQDAGGYFNNTLTGWFDSDMFIAKFDNSANLLWSTFFGGDSYEEGHSITTDSDGNIYIAGNTKSEDLTIVSAGNQFVQNTNSGEYDIVLLKFDNNTNLLWSTYFGGSESERWVTGLECDDQDRIWVTGGTSSPNFPVFDAGGYFDDSYNGGYDDGYMLMFDNQQELVWSTYIGGSEYDIGSQEQFDDNLVIDECGNVYMSMSTGSIDNPVLEPGTCSFTGQVGADWDSWYVIRFDSTTEMTWGTYLAGTGVHAWNGAALAVNDQNNLFFVGLGYNMSAWDIPFVDPGNNAFYEDNIPGPEAMYVVEFDVLELDTLTSNAGDCGACDGSATVQVCGFPPYTYEWSNGVVVSDSQDPENTITDLCPGLYSVIVYSSCTSDTAYFEILSFSGGGAIESVDSVFSCTGQDIIIGGVVISADTSISDTLFGGSYLGCDSIVTTVFSFTESIQNFQQFFGCPGTEVQVGNNTYSISGTYVDTLSSVSGCDSIVTTELILDSVIQTNIAISECEGYSIFVGGDLVSTSGIYVDSLTSVQGCDSLVVIDLTIHPLPQIVLTSSTDSICSGEDIIVAVTGADSYDWNVGGYHDVIDTSLVSTTQFMVAGTDVNGCTSLDSVEIIVSPIDDPSFGYGQSVYCQSNDDELPNIVPVAGATYSVLPVGLVINSQNGEIAFQASTPGQYIVALETQGKCPNSSSFQIEIHEEVSAEFNYSDSVFCASEEFIEAFNYYSGSSFSSTPAGLSINANTGFIDVSTSVPGAYTIINEVEGGACPDVSYELDLVILELPDFSVIGEVVVCDLADVPEVEIQFITGNSWTFTIVDPTFASTEYTTASSSFFFTPEIEGEYYIIGIENELCFVNKIDTLDLIVHQGPSMNDMDSIIKCDGEQFGAIQFTSSNPGANYTWQTISGSIGQQFNGVGQIPTFTGESNGGSDTFSTVLVISSDSVCVGDSIELVLGVYGEPQVDANFQNLMGCAPLTVLMHSDYDSTYWSLSDMDAIGDSIEMTIGEPGIYTVDVNVFDENGCSASLSFTDIIEVFEVPNSWFSYLPEQPDLLSPEVHLTNESTNGDSFIWFVDGALVSTDENIVHLFEGQSARDYEVCLVTTTDNNCSDTICRIIEVIDPFTLYVPNAFTPGGDGKNDLFLPVLSGQFEDYELFVFNRWGEIIFETTSPNEGWDGTHNGTEVPIGVYVWKIGVRETETRRYHEKVGHVSVVK